MKYRKLKKILKTFQNIVTIFKTNSIDFRFFVFICRASRICRRSLSISCAIIVVFSTRIFRNLDLGIKCVLRCKAIVLESLKCIVSGLERVVRPDTHHFLYIYIYIYIYIVIHRQTVLFYQNSSVWRDTQDARSRDRNQSNFTLD